MFFILVFSTIFSLSGKTKGVPDINVVSSAEALGVLLPQKILFKSVNLVSQFEFDSTPSELFAPSDNNYLHLCKLSSSTLSCQTVSVLTNENYYELF